MKCTFLQEMSKTTQKWNFGVLLDVIQGLPDATVEGGDLLADGLHGYEARDQGNPQVLDGQGFKMMESISTTRKALNM